MIFWNGQSRDGVKVIGSLGWLGVIFEHTVQLALMVQIEVFIPGQYKDLLAWVFKPIFPWLCRLCKTFAHWEVGMMILWSKSTKLLSALRWCLTSQYSQTLGAVRLYVFRNPFCTVSISLAYCGSLCPAAWMKSGKISAMLLLALNVANRVIVLTQSFMSSDSMMSDWEGFNSK